MLSALPPQADAPVAWLGKPSALCQRLQSQWQGRWPQLRVHVAYKPLVAWIKTEWLAAWHQQPPRHVTLHYPVIECIHPERFLQEAYPLAAWLHELGSTFHAVPQPTPAPEQPNPEQPNIAYHLNVDGKHHQVPIPLRWASDLQGRQVLRPTSQLRCGEQHWTILSDTERLWEGYRQLLSGWPLPATTPYFGRLTVRAALCAPGEPLNFMQEALNLQEGLEEDLYFGTLEYLQQRAGIEEGSRSLQPGQIVAVAETLPPEALPSLQVRIEPVGPVMAAPAVSALTVTAPTVCTVRAAPSDLTKSDLTKLEYPLPLAALEGLLPAPERVYPSAQGRKVGLWQRGKGKGGLLLSAGQHANEPTGVVAALRFWQQLPAALTRPVSCIPLENPDGYALYEALRDLNPTHMHHAARYTALGDDLEYRQGTALYEKAARLSAEAPRLHVNLHGYPAHEWTRPMSGYQPQHFEDWALPKGFFLLLRYVPGQRGAAQSLAEAVTAQLQTHQALMAFNAKQRAAYEAHTSARPYQLLRGTPILLQEREDQLAPLTLVTEFPDETLTGATFRLGVEAQLRATQAAWQWLLHQP